MTANAELIDYWHKRPANVARYLGVIFHHPNAGTKRLLQNVPYDLDLLVDSIAQTFLGTAMQIPEEIKLDTDETDKGTITFGRIGADVRAFVDAIGISQTPITARVLTWLGEASNPVNDITLNVGSIAMTESEVQIKLTLGNDNFIGRADEVYTADEYVGLKFV